ncbi:tetratricopeptide repeat protein [Paenibacillus spiritus]|uniref:Tetratricopeptide repeat protein n=1 Tax=Paenibacillus spiritus TaxID=2496557 RepID=A0A5J5GEQ1_9BACL|nr:MULTISPECIES: tetratricopeptide repeat protein [Paenibacillus]KAA9006262.1 tetratricopeptide repeat protein [Paenibacillus spiritus]
MSPEEYVQEAYRCILRSDFAEAILCFEAAIAARPDDAQVRYRCSITYARNGRLDRAVEHAQAAVDLAGEEHPEYRLHLQHLQAMTLVQEARRLLEQEKGKGINPYHPVTLLKEAVSLDPLYGDAYVWLALAYSRVNEHLPAISALREVIALHPDDAGLRELMKDLQKSLRGYMK